MTKICVKCNKEKSLDLFSKRRDMKDKNAYRKICKACRVEQSKIYNRTLNGIISNMYANMKFRTKRNIVPSGNFILKSVFNTICKNSNSLKIIIDNWAKSNYVYSFAPSVDRINSKLGYIEDNIQFLTLVENVSKGQREKNQVRVENGDYMFPTKTHKWCRLCKCLVDKSDFYKAGTKRDGLNYECKKCKAKLDKGRKR